MSCLLCASRNQAEFGTEILIHFSGIANLDKPPVWVFPKLLVCFGLWLLAVHHSGKRISSTCKRYGGK